MFPEFEIIGTVDLDHCHTLVYRDMVEWLNDQCQSLHRVEYKPNQRLIFLHRVGDFYVKGQNVGLITRLLQTVITELQITNCFVTVVTTNTNLQHELNIVARSSDCEESIKTEIISGSWTPTYLDRSPSTIDEIYKYGSVNPMKIDLSELTAKENFLLTKSKVFCIYPWIHLNANPDGRAYPCCMTDHAYSVGNCKTNTLQEIWNTDDMKQVRTMMLAEKKVEGCRRCYEQEQSGFFSGRLSANKHHGHHIGRVAETADDGSLDRFEMVYWDIRFSNLCNLRCRSCGHIYSSQWYRDQAQIAGPQWQANHQVLNYAGRYETDMWDQLIEHIDHVEQIYFAGGEPLIMEEHYRILEELERRERFDVRLIYNTNFTEVHLKDRLVFDYWKKFDSVSVGASLDAMGRRAEYIRKGTRWTKIEQNRQKMLEICPQVDFYVSSTLSLLNAWHVPDFHKDWTARGLIKAQDWNVNILLDPVHYRVDAAPIKYKQRLRIKFEEHVEWLAEQDRLGRASQGYQSAIKFMMTTDRSDLLPLFWQKSDELDRIRKEKLLDFVPELEALL